MTHVIPIMTAVEVFVRYGSDPVVAQILPSVEVIYENPVTHVLYRTPYHMFTTQRAAGMHTIRQFVHGMSFVLWDSRDGRDWTNYFLFTNGFIRPLIKP